MARVGGRHSTPNGRHTPRRGRGGAPNKTPRRAGWDSGAERTANGTKGAGRKGRAKRHYDARTRGQKRATDGGKPRGVGGSPPAK